LLILLGEGEILVVGVVFCAPATGTPINSAATVSVVAVRTFIVYSLFKKYLKQQQALCACVPDSIHTDSGYVGHPTKPLLLFGQWTERRMRAGFNDHTEIFQRISVVPVAQGFYCVPVLGRAPHCGVGRCPTGPALPVYAHVIWCLKCRPAISSETKQNDAMTMPK
jgi:hypothetical protein